MPSLLYRNAPSSITVKMGQQSHAKYLVDFSTYKRCQLISEIVIHPWNGLGFRVHMRVHVHIIERYCCLQINT